MHTEYSVLAMCMCRPPQILSRPSSRPSISLMNIFRLNSLLGVFPFQDVQDVRVKGTAAARNRIDRHSLSIQDTTSLAAAEAVEMDSHWGSRIPREDSADLKPEIWLCRSI